MRAIQTLLFLVTICYAESSVDKLVGTWKMNAAKSKTTNTADQMMKIEKVGPNTIRVSIDLTTKSGEKRSMQYTRICDGKEHHTEGLAPDVTETCDPNTLNVLAKRNGTPSGEMHLSIAGDGKSHTVTRKSLRNDQSEETLVFDRQ
jgi:hypothetical protein